MSGPDVRNPREVDFGEPPVNEVSFGVQFAGEVMDDVTALSDFRPLIKSEFPSHEKQPPLAPAVETFSLPATPQPSFQFLQTPPGQRYWFGNDDGTRLIQVQPDRFIFNWRQVKGDEQYPTYDVLAPLFFANFEVFLGLLRDDRPPVALFELQYINAIEPPGRDGIHGDLGSILNFVTDIPNRSMMPDVEDIQLQRRHRLLDKAGEPYGRMYLTAVPALRNIDQVPVYAVTLLVRGHPTGGDTLDSARKFMAEAHRLIVSGFREVTTEVMHERWRIR